MACQAAIDTYDHGSGFCCGECDFCRSPISQKIEEEEVLRPILVGYAFGPKKMSTMGVVMAEASKAYLSTLASTVLVEGAEEDEAADNDDSHHNDDDLSNDKDEKESQDCHQYPLNISANPPKNGDEKHATPLIEIASFLMSEQEDASAGEEVGLAGDTSTYTSNADPSPVQQHCSPSRKSSHPRERGNILLSLDSYSGGLKNIVRYLHNSCSSVDTNSTSTTLLTTGTTATKSTSCKLGAGSSEKDSSTSQSQYEQNRRRQQRIRVSFVPLDPDWPLEGQHGAKMDIILHKLTEDILCLSKYSPLYPTIVPKLGEMNKELEQLLKEFTPDQLPQDAQDAILRVHRLMQYQKKYPDCTLADDPSKVLTLMSRSDIAHALAECLVGVTSTSGIPVAAPKFVVWNPVQIQTPGGSSEADITECLKESHIRSIAQRLKDAELSYPLIAKPLQAAGTKSSHYMTVLLNESSLGHIHESPCLLQEYANHGAVLYKVYVLGNNVRVYQRPSLPNLPPLGTSSRQATEGNHQRSPSYVDFDSQRPYPRLSAFGVNEGKGCMNMKLPAPPFLLSLTASAVSSNVAVTAEEVQPIVDTLKKAFGLELFGFDILITSVDEDENDSEGNSVDNSKRQMLVVDVNYFPSYKEVSNFPSLLAQYLTQRAVDSRRKQSPAGKTNDEAA